MGEGWAFNTEPSISNQGVEIAIIGTVFTTFSAIFVSLRWYIRTLLLSSVGVDDWTILVTCFFSVSFLCISIWQTKWGLGLQMEDFPVQNVIPFGKLQYAAAPLYIIGIMGFKISLLFSYIRIGSSDMYRAYINRIKILIALTFVVHMSFLFTQLFLCSPVSFQWDQIHQTGKCLDGPTVYYSMASITVLFDIIVIVAPIPLLAYSRIRRREKVVLAGLFALGFFVTTIQLIRIFAIKNMENSPESSGIALWSMVELNLGIMITCIPTFSPLFRYYNEQSYGSGSPSRSSPDAPSDLSKPQKRRNTKDNHLDLFQNTSNRRSGIVRPKNLMLRNLSHRRRTVVTFGCRAKAPEARRERDRNRGHDGREVIIGKALTSDSRVERIRAENWWNLPEGDPSRVQRTGTAALGGIRTHTEVLVTVEPNPYRSLGTEIVK